MPQRDRQKQALIRLQRRVDWLTRRIGQDSEGGTVSVVDGGGGGVSTWDALTDKPTVLTPPGFNAGDFPSAENLAAADIATALSHSPGLAGGIQTSIRVSGSATDDALATEQAIREAVNAVGAESLSDLSDVTLDAGTLYQDGYVLQGDGSGAYNDTQINEVLDSGNLGSLGSVSTASRSDGDVLQWVDGNLQYEHIAPADLISGSVGLDDLTDVTLNDTTKYEPQDVLAGNGSGKFVDKTIDTVLGEAEVQDLGNIANPSTDGNVIADQGGTYGAEAITSVTSGHVDWTDLQNVNHSNLKTPQVGYYDDQNSEWINGFIADLIRDRGALSVGDVSFAASWRTIESDTEPTQRPDGDPLQEGDVWIDTDSQPVAEAYVFRNGTFQKTASAIGGNNIVTDSIDATKITADTITANQIKADTITANEIVADTITANQISADTITAGEITANTITSTEIQADAITGDLIDASTSITVGNSLPDIKIDGSVDPSRIESTNFASLTSGFRIQSDGTAEFGDIRARGSIRSAVFERDEQVLRGGTDIVTPSTTLAQDAAAGDTTIEVDSVPFSAGDDIRFKEAGTTEIRTISSISGTTLTLNSGLSSAKTSGAAIARWNAERIIHSADNQFDPFTAYVDNNNNEFLRIGNISGRAGQSGFGLSLGTEALIYDSEADALEINSGQAGPFSINTNAIDNGSLFIDAGKNAIYFNSDINPDLQLAVGEFDRASLPDVSDISSSSSLADVQFNNDLSSWSTLAIREVGEYTLDSANNEFEINPQGPGSFPQFHAFADANDLGDFDTDGDNVVDTSKTVKSFGFNFDGSLSVGTGVEGNRLEVPTTNATIDASAGRFFTNSSGSGTFFTDTGNNPTDGLRARISSAAQFDEIQCKPVMQNADLSGLGGETVTLEVNCKHVSGDQKIRVVLLVTTQSTGAVVDQNELVSTFNPSGGLGNDTASFKLSFTVPASDEKLRVGVPKFRLKAVDDSLDSDGNPTTNVTADIESIRLKDSLFNSVIASDGMLWRDQNNNDQLDFDVNSGKLKVRNFVGVGFSGAGIQVNNNGELEAVDESGNTTVIS